jgi:hypothetical protein
MLPFRGFCRVCNLLLALGLLATIAPVRAQQNLIGTGADWNYWDFGPADENWWHPDYFDFDWDFGPSPLGFGEDYIVTRLQSTILTGYFRHYFVVNEMPTAPLTLRVRRDDGVIVYLNGWEILRDNMPDGDVEYDTPARNAVEAVSYLEKTVDPAFLILGYNVIAAEVHQPVSFSQDLVFDLQLQSHTGGSQTVLRGPYLQLGTPTSIVVKWRTTPGSDSVVRYGLTPENLNQIAQDSTLTTEHEVPLTGLSPDTKYYYSIGSATSTNAFGPDHFFITSPAAPKPTRIWVIGDSGTAAAGAPGAAQVRNAYYAYAGSRYTDLWLMLGDNAYYSGTDLEYQRGMFDVYPDILRQTVVWPTIGNHDTTPAYFEIFTLPRNGEAGGVPSGVENYYSFDYGDIHFVCLGGYFSGSLLSNGVMCTWLKADLEANTNKWLIAFWHQPPYSKGSHDSDTEDGMIQMRENAVPILESFGVDLVLCGHSHNYERSYLLRGHYGHSSTLEPSMLLDDGSGRTDDTGAYNKQTTANHGTVYVVAGSSGWISGCCWAGLNHPAIYRGLAEMGSLVLDIDGDTLNAKFLRENGAIDDYFTIVKESTVVEIVTIDFDNGTATLSWTSTPGRSYLVEFTANLGAGWTPIGDPIPATGAITETSHTTGAALKGFYRVLQLD